MNAPLKPHEVVAHAVLVVADPEAAMRKDLVDMIEGIVHRQVYEQLIRMADSGELDMLLERTRQHRDKQEMLQRIMRIDQRTRTHF